MFKVLTSAFILATILVVPSLGNAQTTLMMAEEPGCIWCAAWNREIGPVYDKTGEGAAAALRRVDITDPIPDDITLSRAINFTPTFVLLIDRTEVSRLEGYPGEDFFWGLLGMMLNEQDIPFEIKTAEDLSQ
ncbi:hypothetical protein OAE29_05830 [Octadecabacter sp.]|nr:hypothetical protein [Octadecabacter sp.]